MKAWIAILLMFFIFLIGAGAAGFGVWYWQNNIVLERESEFIQKEATLDAKFGKQEKELNSLRTEIATSKLVLDEQNKVIDEIPLLVFTPEGSFSEAEKKDIEKKLFNPYVDYYSNEGYELITMDVQIYDEEDYNFTVNAILSDGIYNGFLWGTKGEEVQWWVPECMDDCNFSLEFKENYPKVIEAYQKMKEVSEE